MNSRPFHMIKNKFKKGFHPIMYREKKGGRQDLCVSRKKKKPKRWLSCVYNMTRLYLVMYAGAHALPLHCTVFETCKVNLIFEENIVSVIFRLLHKL